VGRWCHRPGGWSHFHCVVIWICRHWVMSTKTVVYRTTWCEMLYMWSHFNLPHKTTRGKECWQWTVDGTNKGGRPCREWMDDIVNWYKTGVRALNSLAQDCRRWKLITRQAMDTNGRCSHGSWRRMPLGLAPSTLYSIHFFTQSLSSFHNTCPCHRNLFCCSTEIVI